MFRKRINTVEENIVRQERQVMSGVLVSGEKRCVVVPKNGVFWSTRIHNK